MPLTDIANRGSRPESRHTRIFDGGGLYLEIAPSGCKWWRYKYRFNGKEKRLSLGVYPDVLLREARERRHEFRAMLADGIDPGQHRKAAYAAGAERAANSFEVVAREWIAKFAPIGAATHSSKVIRRLEKDVYPWISARPISEVTAMEVLSRVRRTEARGAVDTAHRALRNCRQVFRYGVQTGRCQRDPTADIKGALAPAQHEHFPAITDPIAVGELLRALDGFKGTFVVQCALKLAPLFFVRPRHLHTR